MHLSIFSFASYELLELAVDLAECKKRIRAMITESCATSRDEKETSKTAFLIKRL